ncbi:MAG: Coq4 family protein [Planctomycetota bacterium]
MARSPLPAPLSSLRLWDVHLIEELRGVVGLLRDPHDIQNIYKIEDGLLETPSTCLAADFVRQQPGCAEIIEERYLRNAAYDMDMMRQLPEGTLGREFAHHLDLYDFDPQYYQVNEVKDDATYVLARIRETHDIWHVVTGFYPTPIGEIGIKAVELAQVRRPMAAVLCAGAVLRYMLRTPQRFGDLLLAISAGYQMGLHAKPLLAQKWEQMWDRPVEDIRRDMGIPELTDENNGKLDPDGVKASRPNE